MVSLRLRYENGHFLPLEPISGLQEGEEITVQWESAPSNREAIKEMLEKTAGLWADIEGIEEFLADARHQWDKEWENRINSWDEA